jgi:cytochrome c553
MKKTIAIVTMLAFGSFLTAKAEDAKTIWAAQCTKCHGADGKGQTAMGKKLKLRDFTDAKVQADLKDDAMAKAIKEGLKTKEGNTLMKPVENASAADITALVQMIRGMKK